MLRNVLAVLAGICGATILFMGFERLQRQLYPFPNALDPADHEAMSAYAKTLPTKALLVILVGWILGSFACGLLMRVITRKPEKTAAYLAGLFLTTAGIVDVFMLPRPIWFIIAGIIVFIPFTLLGHSIIKR